MEETVTITYSLEPNPKWYFANLVGVPLGAGYIQVFESLNHSVQKLVYEDDLGATPWPTVVIGGVNSIMVDENGTQGPFYWKLDASNPTDLYYIRVYDLNNVFQWDIDNFPGDITAVPTPPPTTFNGLENLIVNSVMNHNFGSANPIASTAFKIAPSAHSFLAQTSSNCGPDIWFIKSNTSASDILQFLPFTLGSTALTGDVTPYQYLNYTCSVAGTETFKYVQFPITQNVQNLTGVTVTFSLWARCNSGNTNINVSVAQFFGDGNAPSPTVISTVQSFTLTSAWTKLTFPPFVIPSVSGKVLGTCGNSGLFVQVNYPIASTTSIDFTKLCMYTGSVIPSEQYTPYDMTDAVVNSPRTGQTISTCESTPPFGYIAANGGTIGSGSSGATTLAGTTAFPLYNLLWNNFLDAWSPVSGGRGASAVADFNANNTINLAGTNGLLIASLNALSPTLTFTTNHGASNTNFIISSTTGFRTGSPVQLTTTGSLPTNFLIGVPYFVILVDSTHIQLAGDIISAFDNTPLTFSADGTGTIQNALGLTTGNANIDGVGAHTHSFSDGTFVTSATLTAGEILASGEDFALAVSTGSVSGTTGSTGTPFSIIPPTIFMNLFVKL